MTGFLADPIPKLYLESMDASVSIPLDGSTGWIRMPGATGLEMPPVEVISSPIPGVAGSTVQEVRVQERPVFLPIYGRSDTTLLNALQLRDQLRSLVDPTNHNFRLVGHSVRGVRELVVTYESGLEGNDGQDQDGLSWFKAGIKAVAHQPYAQDLADTLLPFSIAENPSPFIGIVGGTDAPWPTMLSANAVIGNGMTVTINSEAPVYPKVVLTGPMNSFSGELTQTVTQTDGSVVEIVGSEWYIEVSSAITGGSELVVVTDPRARSIRYNGGLAAGMISRTSKLRPFYPGTNVLNVSAPGGTSATRIVLSYRNLYRSLW